VPEITCSSSTLEQRHWLVVGRRVDATHGVLRASLWLVAQTTLWFDTQRWPVLDKTGVSHPSESHEDDEIRTGGGCVYTVEETGDGENYATQAHLVIAVP